MKKNENCLRYRRGPGLLIFLLAFTFNTARAQNVTVSGAGSGNGSYVDLSSAFAAINGGSQSSANITVSIAGNLTESVTAVLNSGAWSSLVIMPSGGNAYTVTGALAGPLVDLNGASGILIDGLNTGGHALTLVNTDQGPNASTLRYLNGASGNTVTNVSLQGSSTASLGGVVHFSNTTGSGNSNNLISGCLIGPAAAGNPVNGIYSAGTSTAANTGNVIQNNNIFDYFSPNFPTSGIFADAGSDAWTVTGNRLYQTAVRTYTSAQTHKAIFVNGGSGYVISANTIGYASASASGLTEMTSTVAIRYAAIQVNAATVTVNSIQGNTVSAISFTTTSNVSTANGILCGVYIAAGSADIGTSTGNQFGATSGNGHFSAHTSGSGGMVVGISASTTGSVTISNNTFGGFRATSAAAATGCGLSGINVSAAAASMSITNNTFGNATANNMEAGTNGVTTGATSVSGINLPTTPNGTITISGNTIRNFASFGTGTGYVRGIWTAGSTVATSTYFITNNLVTGLSANSALTTISNGQAAAVGIVLGTGGNCVVASNTVSGIALTNTGAVANIALGIAYANTTNSTLRDNLIYDITNSSTNATTPPVAAGIIVRSGTNDAWIHNNMISLGGGSSSNTSFIGIQGNHGSTPNPTVNIFFNTINIQGTVSSGSLSTFGVHRGDLTATARNMIYNIRNNLITNTRSGGTGGHYAIGNNFNNTTPSATGWTSDYNVLNANAATIGHWTSAQTFAGWKTASSSDANSLSGITVTYVNAANDLHLNFGTTPTQIESGGQNIAGFTTDFDQQTRPGPAGSVNGGGVSPDIGADEFDGVVLDLAAPLISHTTVANTCATGDRTLTANILDVSGVPVTGTLQPRIYFAKNAGSWFSSQGSLQSGSATNGMWTFTVSASALSGLTSNDVVSYYFVAQDIATTPNIGAGPQTGFAATDVNNVTTPPTTPYTYTILNSLSGTYTVGSGGTYTTLTDAAQAYNTSCLAGPVTFLLTDALYSTAETFPVVFMNNPDASASFSLLIRPAGGVAASISGTNTSAAGVLKFLDARFITVDGINSGGSSLGLFNPNTGNSAGVWLAGGGNGNQNISIRNLTITGGGTTTATNYGIVAGNNGTTPGTTAGANNDNIVVEGVTILRTFRGIWGIGTATVSAGGMDNWSIINNQVGPVSSGTNNLGGIGIYLNSAINATIANNQVRNVSTAVTATTGGIGIVRSSGATIHQNTVTAIRSSAGSSGINSVMGIRVGALTFSTSVTMNVISGIENTNTAGWGARGLVVADAGSITVQNNMISDVASYSDEDPLYWPIGIALEGTSSNVNLDFNSVNLFGNHAGLSSAAQAAGLYIDADGPLVVRNNIVSNTYDNTGSGTDSSFAIYCRRTNTVFATIDYNAYYAGGTAAFTAPGHLTIPRANLAAIQTAFGSNVNSAVAPPLFVSNTDLHLQLLAGNLPFENKGTPVSGITQDIDLQSRNATTPDMGADEFTIPVCASANAGVISPATGTACAGATVAANATGVSTGLQTSYQWRFATTPGGPYIPIPGGQGGTTPSFTSSPLASGVYYIVFTASCSAISVSATSNEGTLTVHALPSAVAAAGSGSACSGGSITLTGTSGTGSSFNWTGPDGFTSTSQNPALNNLQLTASGTYSFSASHLGCASATSTVALDVKGTPTSLTVTPALSNICSGDSALLTSAGGLVPDLFAQDGRESQNANTAYPAPYSMYYGGQKMQMLILASELTAQGISAGTLTALQFPVVSLGANWGTSVTELQSFQVSIGNTNLNALAGTMVGGLTVVSTAANFTPVVGYGNMHAFNTPFVWNGTSNIIVETVFSNNLFGSTGEAVIQYHSATSFQSTQVYRADNQTFATIAAATGTNGTVGLVRPDFRLHWLGDAPMTWSPAAGLSSVSNVTVNASPAANTIYTVTANNGGCTSATSTSVDVTPRPSLTITASSPSVCAGGTVSLVASGGITYTWSTQDQVAAITVTPSGNTTYSVSSVAAPCPQVTETVAITVNPLPVISISPGNSTVCANSVITFTGSGGQNYVWSTGTQGNTQVVTATGPSTLILFGDDGAGCGNSDTVFVATTPNPTVQVSASAASVCATSPVSFTASGATNYSWSTGASSPGLTLTPSASTVVTVTGSLGTGCVDSETVGVHVFALPVVTASSSRDTVCIGESQEITAGGANTYQWMPGAGSGASLVVTPNSTITYTVTGTGANNCTNTATVTLIVDPCTSVGNAQRAAAIALYPNPSTGQVTIEMPFEGKKTVTVFNAAGAVVQVITTGDFRSEVSLDAFAKGIYFVRIAHGSEVTNVKVILE